MTSAQEARVRFRERFVARHPVLVIVRADEEAAAVAGAEHAWHRGADGVLLALPEHVDRDALEVRIRRSIRPYPPWFVASWDDAGRATEKKGLHFGVLGSDPAIDVAVVRGSPEEIGALRAAVGERPIAVRDPDPELICGYLSEPMTCFIVNDDDRVGPMIGEVRAHDGQSRLLSGLLPRSARGQAVVLSDLVSGPVIEIDLDAFEEDEPMFAVSDGEQSTVDRLEGLEPAGELELGRGHRAVTLRARRGSGRFARFRLSATGEFELKVFHLREHGAPRLVWRDDFCLK